MIEVEVVFAAPDRQDIFSLLVAANTSARQAVEQSRLNEKFPEYDFRDLNLGIYSIQIPDDHLLQAGDRVEVYRPLQQSPTEARRLRAKSARLQNNQSRT